MTYVVRFVDLQEQHVAVVRGEVEHDGIGPFVGQAFAEVMAAAEVQGLKITGPPFSRYGSIEEQESGWKIAAGFPVSGPIDAVGRVTAELLPGGTAAATLHIGPYTELGKAYEAAMKHVIDEGYQMTADPWECYLDGPEVPEPRTELFVPCERMHAHHA
jgi:effector-binding domain-containing protein